MSGRWSNPHALITKRFFPPLFSDLAVHRPFRVCRPLTISASSPTKLTAGLNRRKCNRQSMHDDPFDLNRFLRAQESNYERALDEVRSGRKRSHWMWYVFPQVAGLGQSAISQHYAIKNLDEARAYLAHPILGPRLTEC